MEWTIEYLEKDGIVAAKITGDMNWEEHRKFAEEIYPLAHKKGYKRILIDFREMVPGLSVLQVDDLPKLLKKLGVGPDMRIAAIHDMSSPKANDFTFFKNAATLLSLQVRIFSDKEAAIAWLKTVQ